MSKQYGTMMSLLSLICLYLLMDVCWQKLGEIIIEWALGDVDRRHQRREMKKDATRRWKMKMNQNELYMNLNSIASVNHIIQVLQGDVQNLFIQLETMI